MPSGAAPAAPAPTAHAPEAGDRASHPAPARWLWRRAAAPADPLARPVGADAFRVLAVFLVGWFHLWQQSWRTPHSPLLAPVVRTGYVWVDAMILLSAFCLFLPSARALAAGRLRPVACGQFYARRAVRILPGYYLNIAVSTAVALAGGAVWDKAFGWDLVSHLTLTHTLCRYGYPHTRLNGVTWTVGVLAGFYLLFPLLARTMAARPARTMAGLFGMQAVYSCWALGWLDEAAYPAAFNRLPGFAGVLALGMGGALWLAKAGPALLQKRWGRPAGALLALAAAGGICWMQGRLRAEEVQRWQLAWRMPLALLFCALLLGLCLWQPPGRRAWAALGGISYGFYLWHQVLAVWLKYTWRIPAWQGDTPPNQLGDAAWSARYELLCWAAALAAAVLSTYCVEKPAARWLRRLWGRGGTDRAGR